MKKIFLTIALAVLLIPTLASAYTLEYPYLNKSVRAMGMGGAFLTAGDDPQIFYYNPAGLAKIGGFNLGLLGANVEAGTNALRMLQDFQNLKTTGNDPSPMLALVSKYQGKLLHIDAGLSAPFITIGGFGIGAIGNGQVNAAFHNPMSTTLVDINGGANYGAQVGLGLNLTKRLKVGVAGKYVLSQFLSRSYNKTQLLAAMVSTSDSNPIADDIKNSITEGTAQSNIAFDVGAIYSGKSSLKPSVGVSVLNIGGIKQGCSLYTDSTNTTCSTYDKIPMTANVGVSLEPSLLFLKLKLAADFDDFLYAIDSDKSLAKRLHLGAEAKLNLWIAALSARVGLYQGYPTLGVGARVLFLRANVAYYTEELGAYGGQDPDHRLMANVEVSF